MLLTQLNKGECAKIKDLSSVQDLIQKRLHHLGIHENSEVCLKNKLPFGGPCMIDCGGQCISIRKHEASLIMVEIN